MGVVNPQVCFPSCNLVMGGGDAYKTWLVCEGCLFCSTVTPSLKLLRWPCSGFLIGAMGLWHFSIGALANK